MAPPWSIVITTYYHKVKVWHYPLLFALLQLRTCGLQGSLAFYKSANLTYPKRTVNYCFLYSMYTVFEITTYLFTHCILLVLQNTRVILWVFKTTVLSVGFNTSPFSNFPTGLQSGPGTNNINYFCLVYDFLKPHTHTNMYVCVISSIPCRFKLCGKINVFCAAKRIYNNHFNTFNRVM